MLLTLILPLALLAAFTILNSVLFRSLKSYAQIKLLWKDLKRTKKQLGIGEPPTPEQEDQAS